MTHQANLNYFFTREKPTQCPVSDYTATGKHVLTECEQYEGLRQNHEIDGRLQITSTVILINR